MNINKILYHYYKKKYEKYRKKVLTKEQIKEEERKLQEREEWKAFKRKWKKYDILNEGFICGLCPDDLISRGCQGEDCTSGFNEYGCMYVYKFKDY